MQEYRWSCITTSHAEIEVCFQPCTPEEVSLRLRIAISRNAPLEASNTITRGDLVIDCDRYEVTLKGFKVDLTYKEYELLKYLASNPGRVFTRESLLRCVWEYDYFGGTRTVDVHIRRLRSKIDDVSNHFIETQWNVGYRFRAADKPSQPSQENSWKFKSTINTKTLGTFKCHKTISLSLITDTSQHRRLIDKNVTFFNTQYPTCLDIGRVGRPWAHDSSDSSARSKSCPTKLKNPKETSMKRP